MTNWCSNMLLSWIIFGLLSLDIIVRNGVHAFDHVISEQRDHKVLLSCPIDFKACGELHSVKWFKGNSRIAVVSGDGEVATVKDEYMSRMSIDHLPKGPVTSLSIKSLQIDDEDVYTCESTFLEPRESCDTSGVYRIDLKVEVPPSAVHILDDNGKFVKNGTKYGPLREGDKLKSICEVKATRPIPTVTWYRGGKQLTDSTDVHQENGLFYVKSELLLILSRAELGNNIECRVESPSLDDEIISNYIVLDLEVPPTFINLTGVEHHTVQGTNVLLQCKVYGARPAVTITWYNSSREIDARHSSAVQIETKSIEQRDGTYETISELKFTATRYEDGIKFRCEAQNAVMRERKDKPLHESLPLEVLYPPVVSVKPENLTVKEGEEALLVCDYEANPATLHSVKWYLNGKAINLAESDRYEGGNPEHTALLVKKSLRYDDGAYTCELTNDIGAEMSDNEIYLEVQFPPVVNLTMDPDTPMIENDEGNVTLYCNVLEGNPPNLSKVRWFLGGELLKELPECNGDGSDELCNIDPSRLLLQNIGRQFLGNYSCEGFNSAGWGSRSKESELIVYYEPGNASIHHNPQTAVKRKSVSFTCSVDDPGFPATTTYHWLRGGRVVHEVTSNLYTVDPVGLDSRTNFSCYAFNAGGNGNSATVLLDVHAAPAFINPLMPYTGVLYSTDNASLTCRVECVPECSISWFKDGVGIDESSDKYYISQKYLEADPATGDFESVLSVLNFNMTSWPQGKFDIYGDNANYSCVSTNNSAGPGVRSATYFGIEYPPENTTVSKDAITVEEDNIPERVLCTAKANPEPLYEWIFNGSVVTRGSALIINHKMAKSDAGGYECFSYNKHGRHSAVTNITVTFKPTCEIQRKEINDEDTLICTANGNPKEADFQWSIKSENDSIELGSGRIDGESSLLILDDEFSVTRIYRCVANNSVGAGPYCQIEVAGHLSWWQRWDKITLIILVASVLGVLLAVIVLCCVIVCICRRKRRRDKYHTDVSISATQSVLSYQASPPPLPPQSTPIATQRITPEIPKSPPKWPLRPGVMVHVKGNTKQSMCANRSHQAPPLPPSLSASKSNSTSFQDSKPKISLPSNILMSGNVPTPPLSPQRSHSNPNQNLENQPKSLPSSSSLSPPLSTLVAPQMHSNHGHKRAGIAGDTGVLPSQEIDGKSTVTSASLSVCQLEGKVMGAPMHQTSRVQAIVHINPNNNILTGEQDNEDVPPPLPKRNILPASRNSTNANNISECSTNELLPRKSKKRRNKDGFITSTSDNDEDDEDSSIGCRPLQSSSNDVQPQDRMQAENASGSNAGGSGLFEKIFGEIFSRPASVHRNHNDVNETESRTGNFRNHFRNFFGTSNVFRRKRLERSDSSASNPFATEHRIKGIRCSGVITYKRTPAVNSSRFDETTDDNRLSPTCRVAASPRNELNNNGTKQINNKSSALGDPLTEPGEYENLPFHGLQTAPNKFATTPSINFNSSNVVRVAPRPKQVTNNSNATNPNSYEIQRQQLQQQQHHYPLNQSHLLKNSYPLSTSQTLLLSSSSCANKSNSVLSATNNADGRANYSSSNESGVGGGGGMGHLRQYSLSNCFPTSYTAYYQQQQQDSGTTRKSKLSDQSFITNKGPYTVQSQNSSSNSHNPFIIQNLRKFNTNSGCSRQGGSHRKKPPDPDKKFYSLKSLGSRKGGGLHFCKNSISSSKCKRHHSFACGSVGDIVTGGNGASSTPRSLPFSHQNQNDGKIKFYEPPLYENLTDSIQIHESSMVSNRSNSQHHHHHQQQPPLQASENINNLMEPERLSIYRSDSGISNSSYECVTPVPAPRQLLKRKSSSIHSSKHPTYSPLYMNVSNKTSTGCCSDITQKPPPLPSGPPATSSLQHGSSTSSSSSSTCTIAQHHQPNMNGSQQASSLNASSNPNSSNSSSSNGNGSHCNGANKCNQTNNNNSKDAMDSYCHHHLTNPQQHQDPKLNHWKQSQHHQHELQHAKHGLSSRHRCKNKLQKHNSASLLSLEHVSDSNTTTNNPLLATEKLTSSSFNSLNDQRDAISTSSSSSTTAKNDCRTKPGQSLSNYEKSLISPSHHTSFPSSLKSLSFTPVIPQNHSNEKAYFKPDTNQAKTATFPDSYGSYNSDNNLTDHQLYKEELDKYSHCKTNGYVIRPVKLPLRKHHSFHFQPSQTVAGSSNSVSNMNNKTNSNNKYVNNYKLSGGPLVFKPLLNENTAFKPITPAKNMSCQRIANHTTTPRICGTSLKRHMSNVESYDETRYKKHSSNSSGLNAEGDISENENEIDGIDDEEIDEIIMTQKEDTLLASPNSAVFGKRFIYGELAPINSSIRSNHNVRSTSYRSNRTFEESEDLAVNSDSEQIRRGNRFNNTLPFVEGVSQRESRDDSQINDRRMLGSPTAYKNHHNSANYNEVHI